MLEQVYAGKKQVAAEALYKIFTLSKWLIPSS
jgi:hypothetical protein